MCYFTGFHPYKLILCWFSSHSRSDLQNQL